MAWSLIEQIEQHEGLIKPTEAAVMLRCTRKCVYDKINRGEIPVIDAHTKLIDPASWKYVLTSKNPILRAASRSR